MSVQERNEIASVISSILISTTRRMTIRQLNYDFQNTEGYKIPFQKFGCKTLEEFLRTLSDKVQVVGSGNYAVVQAVINQKTAHINDLISKQRTVNKNTSRPFIRRNFHTPKSFQTDPQNQSTPSMGAIPKQIPNNSRSADLDEIFFSDDENIQNIKVPLNIQDKLWRLITKHPNGILSSNIIELYKKEYGENLKFSEYGYRSIAQMCIDLRNIFVYVQVADSEITLFDKRKPIPENTVNVVRRLQMMKIKASVEASTEGAIPQEGVEEMMSDIYSEKTPTDIVKFGTQLEQQWIDPGTTEQDYIDVNVAEVYDPSKFWINMKIYANKLNNLMDNLQIFYAIHKQELLVPYYALKKDLYIVCMFMNEYHRAKIVNASLKHESVIKVYFIDYGTVSVVSVDGCCYLHNRFAELPEQAIRARLAGIYPPSENEQWSRSAASRFLSLVMQKDLVAQITRIDEKQRILDIILADTSIEDEDFFINDALVKMGYALFTNQERAPAENTDVVPIVRYIHLFPTHYELENGLVPTAVQMIGMHYAGMAIERIYPHYFKDAKTGQPYLSPQKGVEKDLPVNYDVERPYYEEDEYYDENCEEGEGYAQDSDLSGANSSKSHWQDLIEELKNETRNENVENSMPDVYSVTNTDSDAIHENIRNTIVECRGMDVSPTARGDRKCPRDDTDVPSELGETTNVTNDINGETDAFKNAAMVSVSTQSDGTSDFHDHNCKIINHNECQKSEKPPLKPPPGYHNVRPNETTYKYNYTQASPATNNIANQTYINFLMPYAATYMSHNPYLSYLTSPYANANLEYLMRCSAFLYLQQNYNQYYGGANCYYANQGGASAAPPAYDGTNYNASSNNFHASQEIRDERIPVVDDNVRQFFRDYSCGTSTVHETNVRVKTERDEVNIPRGTDHQFVRVNSETQEEIQVDAGSDRSAVGVPRTVDHSVQVNWESESSDSAPRIVPENTSDSSDVIFTDNNNSSSDVNISDESQAPIGVESQTERSTSDSIESPSVAVQKVKGDGEIGNATVGEIKPVETECRFSRAPSELDSVYEDCESLTDAVISEKNTTVTNEYITHKKSRFITPIRVGKVDMHVVSLENEFYFLLAELSSKIFGKSLTAIQIRKLSVGTPYIISVVDIRLKTNPDLKRDLLMYKLITEDELTVDTVPVKYLDDLRRIISSENDENTIINLLKEVDNFLHNSNAESLHF